MMTRTKLPPLCFALACALLGCGEPLADATYEGEARYVISGRLSGRLGDEAPVNPTVGVAWLGASGFLIGNVTSLTPVTATSFPASFRASLFDEPPEGTRPWLNAYFQELITGVPIVRGLRVGVVLAIDDVNGDGRASFTPDGTQIESPDRLFGASVSDVIGFVRNDDAQVVYQGVSIGPGFHLIDPCYTSPLVRQESRTIEVTLFPPARHLSVGAQPTAACPVVLFPRVRGPLQQMLGESAECEAVCTLMTTATCAQACSSEMCLRLVQASRCYAAKRHRLQCLRDQGKMECTSKTKGSFNEGDCPDFNEDCAPVDGEAQVAALAQSPTCQNYCTVRARGVRPEVCSGDCVSEACVAATSTQPCLAAREARLACLSNHSTNWSCTPFFGDDTNLCSATGSFDHLCPDAY